MQLGFCPDAAFGQRTGSYNLRARAFREYPCLRFAVVRPGKDAQVWSFESIREAYEAIENAARQWIDQAGK